MAKATTGGSITSEQSLAKSIAAHTSWAKTEDRTARTAKARAALDQKFLDEAGGDAQRAEHLRAAYYKRLALKSAQARRRRREADQQLAEVETELDALGVGDVA